jgi:hypothetical protein
VPQLNCDFVSRARIGPHFRFLPTPTQGHGGRHHPAPAISARPAGQQPASSRSFGPQRCIHWDGPHGRFRPVPQEIHTSKALCCCSLTFLTDFELVLCCYS